MIQKWNHSHTNKLQVNYYFIAYYYSHSIAKIISENTAISQLYYITVMKSSTKEPVINLEEIKEETEGEREFKTTWGEQLVYCKINS